MFEINMPGATPEDVVWLQRQAVHLFTSLDLEDWGATATPDGRALVVSALRWGIGHSHPLEIVLRGETGQRREWVRALGDAVMSELSDAEGVPEFDCGDHPSGWSVRFTPRERSER